MIAQSGSSDRIEQPSALAIAGSLDSGNDSPFSQWYQPGCETPARLAAFSTLIFSFSRRARITAARIKSSKTAPAGLATAIRVEGVQT